MITTTWPSAPAGFLRAGSSDVRNGRCAAAVAQVQGTGLPAAGTVARELRLLGDVVSGAGTGRLFGTPMTTTKTFGITNGTTLGYPSPGRPRS